MLVWGLWWRLLGPVSYTSIIKIFLYYCCKYPPLMRAPNKYFLIFSWTPLHSFTFFFPFCSVFLVRSLCLCLKCVISLFFYAIEMLRICSFHVLVFLVILLLFRLLGCYFVVLINLIYYFYNFISNGKRTHSKYFSQIVVMFFFLLLLWVVYCALVDAGCALFPSSSTHLLWYRRTIFCS